MIPEYQSVQTSIATPDYFPRVASLLYIGVLFTGLYYSAVNLAMVSLSPWRTVAFIALILLLLALEQFAQRYSDGHSSRNLTIGLLVARMVLFEAVAAVDYSGLFRAFFPLVPFFSYFF